MPRLQVRQAARWCQPAPYDGAQAQPVEQGTSARAALAMRARASSAADASIDPCQAEIQRVPAKPRSRSRRRRRATRLLNHCPPPTSRASAPLRTHASTSQSSTPGSAMPGPQREPREPGLEARRAEAQTPIASVAPHEQHRAQDHAVAHVEGRASAGGASGGRWQRRALKPVPPKLVAFLAEAASRSSRPPMNHRQSSLTRPG